MLNGSAGTSQGKLGLKMLTSTFASTKILTGPGPVSRSVLSGGTVPDKKRQCQSHLEDLSGLNIPETRSFPKVGLIFQICFKLKLPVAEPARTSNP